MNRDNVTTWTGAQTPEWSTTPSSSPVGFSPRVIWSQPCEEMFEYLAQHEPERLLEDLTSGALPPHALTFAAEWAGRIRTNQAAVILRALLEHAVPLVREGAVYGLAHVIEHPGVLTALRAHQNEASERSPGVRAAVREVLEAL